MSQYMVDDGKLKTTQTCKQSVEWWGTWNGSRVKLLGYFSCMAAWLPEHKGGKKHRGLNTLSFILEEPQ